MMARKVWRMAFVAILLFSPFLGLAQGPVFHDIRPGYGVTDCIWLSDYLPALRGTPGDTRVYILDSGVPGGTALILGGTHGNEVAGIMAAVILVERARPLRGRLIVIPHANNANIDYPDPRCPQQPSLITFQGPDGLKRQFRCGARLTNPRYQGADPEKYVNPSGATFPGYEARNLNRCYPGRPDGTLTEQIAYAIIQLIIKENVGIVIDLHEAGVSSRLASTLVSHPRGLEIAAAAVIELETMGIDMKLEQSREEFRGLSHREIGDHTQALSFLLETPNPGQEGGDPVNDPAHPLYARVGIHLECIHALLSAAAQFGVPSVVLNKVPTLEELSASGLATWLNW